MIFHTPDTSMKTLVSCWKRACAFGRPGDYSGHPLAILWENIKFFNKTEHLEQPKPNDDSALVEDMAYSIVLMDYFASKVNEFLKNNMLAEDKKLQALLAEWKDAMYFDPSIAKAANG